VMLAVTSAAKQWWKRYERWRVQQRRPLRLRRLRRLGLRLRLLHSREFLRMPFIVSRQQW
jgi:hypothetical protein